MRVGWLLLTFVLALAFPRLVSSQDEAPTPHDKGTGIGQDDKKQTEAEKKEEERRRRELTEAEKKQLEQAGKACAAGGVMCIVFSILALGGFVVHILILVWIYKDAKARGDSNAVLWILLAFFFFPIGAIVYFFARPKGDMGMCRNCSNKMMVTLTKCPHCGAAV